MPRRQGGHHDERRQCRLCSRPRADRVVDYNAADFTKSSPAATWCSTRSGVTLGTLFTAPCKRPVDCCGSHRRQMDFVNSDRMSLYCVQLFGVTAHTWSGSWRCWTPARSAPPPLWLNPSQTPSKLAESAKLVTCGAASLWPFAERPRQGPPMETLGGQTRPTGHMQQRGLHVYASQTVRPDRAGTVYERV